jgi:dihydroorotase
MNLCIQGGNVFLDGRFHRKDILIVDDLVAGIGNGFEAEEKIDASGKLVVPGLIDPHVHFREPGEKYKEDFVTGSRAALAGGFTTVFDMPNNNPPTTTYSRLQEKKKLAEKAICDVYLHFGGTDDNFSEVRKVNPDSMKIFLGKTTGELFLRNPESLEKHFRNVFPGTVLVFHANANGPEEQAVMETLENLDSVCQLSENYKKKVHIAHASCGSEILLAKKCGTVEVTPHHLFLNSDDAKELGFMGTVYPELRSEALRKSLWENLDNADCIATDHAPHTPEDKEEGAHGFPGLETSLALMLNAYNNGLVGLERLVSMMSSNPARIYGLQKKGRIEKGFFADITIIDPKKEWTIKAEELETKCSWSPWDGKKIKGKAEKVILRGEIAYDQEIIS